MVGKRMNQKGQPQNQGYKGGVNRIVQIKACQFEIKAAVCVCVCVHIVIIDEEVDLTLHYD